MAVLADANEAEIMVEEGVTGFQEYCSSEKYRTRLSATSGHRRGGVSGNGKSVYAAKERAALRGPMTPALRSDRGYVWKPG